MDGNAYLLNGSVTALHDVGHIIETMPMNGSDKVTSPTPKASVDDVIKMMWLICGPIIFVVGMCGNALILVVMTRRQMTGTSTCVHLCIMAVADMVVLSIGLVPEWFEMSFSAKFKEIHEATCKLEKFLFYTSGDTSIWVLVIFTLDRLVAIAIPLRKKSICVPSRAKLFGALAFILAVIKNLHVLWTRGAEYKTNSDNVTFLKSNCGKPTASFGHFESFVRPWIVFSTVSVIPFVVILCCNVVIIRALFIVRKVTTIGALVSPSATERSMIQMTTMCLSASFCFLICITPSIVLVIGRPYWSDTYAYGVAKGISNVLTYVNHSINFFLYCITGRRFRRRLISTLCRPCANTGGRGGDSTMMDTHGTSLHRSSAAGLRKYSVGFGAYGKTLASNDDTSSRESPSYSRSNSQLAVKAFTRINSQQTAGM